MTVAYEQQLDRDCHWALQEGSMHFDRGSAVHESLERTARKLDELGLAYAVVGGMALFFHGYRRFTEAVDVLISRTALKTIHDSLEGRGYVPLFAGSKNLRDANTGVRIEFLIAGEFPGDGKPKPVAFPDPGTDDMEIDGIRFLAVPRLGRLKDLADVRELIPALNLPFELADRLDPFVRNKYVELWKGVSDRSRG